MDTELSSCCEASTGDGQRRRVGLIYDERMCRHTTPDGDFHPENPNRILSIWNKLQSAGITQRCVVLKSKEIEDKYAALVHTRRHVVFIKNISSEKFNSRRNMFAAKFNSIYFNEGSSEAASLAAGSVVEVAVKVAKGELSSAFAIVRPPGHHAEEDQPMGFCLYNNVAIAASYLLNKRIELGIKKILIVDWDVHHGNGTQKMFWKDPRVLFFSVHRHEFGCFYPATDAGSHIMIGEGPGAGYNINVPWENGRCGDADYLAVWEHILIPVAKEFNPDLIIISAGFDAAIGDPLGGCRLTPYGYAVMLKKLMEFAEGKIVMALEGGYNLDSISNSVLACMEVLLEDKITFRVSESYPFESTWRVIKQVRKELGVYWPTIADPLPEKLTTMKSPSVQISSSDSDNEYDTGPHVGLKDTGESVQDIIQPLLKLKIHEDQLISSPSWRSVLANIDIWYASFGSNMHTPRFYCYILGGRVEGMQRQSSGSMAKHLPEAISWKIVPHRLFFGRDYSHTWGRGGVAFLHPEESSNQDKAYVCMYKITLEQFNDVLCQENVETVERSSPLFDLKDLDSIADKRTVTVEAAKKGWYHNAVYLGKENDIPILTMTCSLSHVEGFKSGELPLCAPSKDYTDVLVKGLVEGNQLSEEAARAYIKEAYTKPL